VDFVGGGNFNVQFDRSTPPRPMKQSLDVVEKSRSEFKKDEKSRTSVRRVRETNDEDDKAFDVQKWLKDENEQKK
jgi:hypothetical protein